MFDRKKDQVTLHNKLGGLWGVSAYVVASEEDGEGKSEVHNSITFNVYRPEKMRN